VFFGRFSGIIICDLENKIEEKSWNIYKTFVGFDEDVCTTRRTIHMNMAYDALIEYYNEMESEETARELDFRDWETAKHREQEARFQADMAALREIQEEEEERLDPWIRIKRQRLLQCFPHFSDQLDFDYDEYEDWTPEPPEWFA
jgi:hypothetical protein